MTGPGRLAAPDRIAAVVEAAAVQRRDLDGENIVITAGPTEEPLDPVRFISNRSSGKMGYSLAQAAASRGASVVLVSGPVNLPPPHGVTLVRVGTALEMRSAVLDHLKTATVIVKAAAVADYRVANVSPQKLKKTAMRLSLELDPTPDILAEVGQNKGDRLLIGFVAETENLLSKARRKMESKNCDMVVANLVGRDGSGFEADQNEVTLVMRPVNRSSCRRQQAESGQLDFRPCAEDCAWLCTPRNEADQFRDNLSFYQDLGVKKYISASSCASRCGKLWRPKAGRTASRVLKLQSAYRSRRSLCIAEAAAFQAASDLAPAGDTLPQILNDIGDARAAAFTRDGTRLSSASGIRTPGLVFVAKGRERTRTLRASHSSGARASCLRR